MPHAIPPHQHGDHCQQLGTLVLRLHMVPAGTMTVSDGVTTTSGTGSLFYATDTCWDPNQQEFRFASLADTASNTILASLKAHEKSRLHDEVKRTCETLTLNPSSSEQFQRPLIMDDDI